MPLPRRRRPPAIAQVAQLPIEHPIGRRRSLTAAAAQIQLDEASIRSLKITNEKWQKEAWRMYDIVGEMRFVANRHANSLSRARLYVAEVGDDGKPGEEVTDPDVAALAETVFGGPATKAESMRTIGVQNFVCGEYWIVAESASSGADGDSWYIVSLDEIKHDKTTGEIQVKRPMHLGGQWYVIKAKQDLLIRGWTPHPRVYDVADSPVRATLPVLREIEQLSKLVFSQIDSRLISAGLLLLPQGLDFPHDEDKPGGIQGLQDMILEAAKASLQGAGSAAGLVPILAEAPPELLDKVQHIKFDTPVAAELGDKLDKAIRRLALGLDAPPEVLLGMGGSNHWSAWAINEDEITTQFTPVLTRLCATLNVAWLAPALKVMNKDPENFTFWFDTAAMTVRPNRFEDALQVHERGAITVEALADAGNFDEGDRTTEEQRLELWARKLIESNAQLLSNKALVKLAGLPDDLYDEPQPVPAALQAGQAPGQPPNQKQLEGKPADDAKQGNRELPTQPAGASPAQKGKQDEPNAVTASAAQVFEAILPGAEQIVLRALELAGGRLLDRAARGRYVDVAKFQLHTRVAVVDENHADKLLEGAFAHVGALALHYDVAGSDLTWLLRGYCKMLLMHGHPHSSDLLTETLRRSTRVAS